MEPKINASEYRRAFAAWAQSVGILRLPTTLDAPTVDELKNLDFSISSAALTRFQAAPIVKLETLDRGEASEEASILLATTSLPVNASFRKELEKAWKAVKALRSVNLVIAYEKPHKQITKLVAPSTARPMNLFRSGRESPPILGCGSSLSLANERSCGTLGLLVRLKEGPAFDLYHKDNGAEVDDVLGLTCNHVIGGCNHAPRGLPVIMPGIMDIGVTTSAIRLVGDYSGSAEMNMGLPTSASATENLNRDVSWFNISRFLRRCHESDFTSSPPPFLLSSRQGSPEHDSQGQALTSNDYETPTIHAALTEVDAQSPKKSTGSLIKPNMTVQKWGRTTGHTRAPIMKIIVEDADSALEQSQLIEYSGTVYPTSAQALKFHGSVYYSRAIIVDNTSNRFADAGDSGALVVTSPGRRSKRPPEIVGMLVSASDTAALVLPIEDICETYSFEILTNWRETAS